jgi:maltooligosyltrehalose trehalohydrolase
VTRFGPLLREGGVTFRLWAPAARKVSVVLDRPLAMAGEDGWFALHVAGAGTRYCFRIDDEIDIADPASLFQPEDVWGPSEVIDRATRGRQRTGRERMSAPSPAPARSTA